MTHPISDRAERALRSLFAHAAARPDAPTWLVDQLVDAELHRRGHPDPSGAFHALALTQGSLLKEEYDLSTHGHADGWTLDALLCDPREFMLYSQRHGFPAGDAAVRAIVQALRALCPNGKIVRTHTDGFAALLGPTADQRVDAALVARARTALPDALAALPPGGPRVEFTVGALRLTVADPPNWQVLGPLVWAECERALVIARRGRDVGLLERSVALAGRLPSFD